MNLTDNQQKVIDAISQGANTPADIAEKTGASVQSVNSTLTSLEKKELITKNKDKTVSLTESQEPNAKSQPPTANSQEPTPILIPYIHSGNGGEELKYALRSFEENLRVPFSVIVIGDKEDWFDEENIIHLPIELHTIKVDGKEIINPQVDVANKIITAIASLGLEDDIILTNDDIFLLGKTDLADLKPYAFGFLNAAGSSNGIYQQNAQRTQAALEKNGLPTRRYGTHTPVLLHAEKLAHIIEKYSALDKGHLLTSLYFNQEDPFYRPIQVNGGLHDPVLASVYKANPSIAPLHKAVKERKFMNCNTAGWTAVKPIMKSLFPNKSKFEK